MHETLSDFGFYCWRQKKIKYEFSGKGVFLTSVTQYRQWNGKYFFFSILSLKILCDTFPLKQTADKVSIHTFTNSCALMNVVQLKDIETEFNQKWLCWCGNANTTTSKMQNCTTNAVCRWNVDEGTPWRMIPRTLIQIQFYIKFSIYLQIFEIRKLSKEGKRQQDYRHQAQKKRVSDIVDLKTCDAICIYFLWGRIWEGLRAWKLC